MTTDWLLKVLKLFEFIKKNLSQIILLTPELYVYEFKSFAAKVSLNKSSL